jgi:hypothetical protein
VTKQQEYFEPAEVADVEGIGAKELRAQLFAGMREAAGYRRGESELKPIPASAFKVKIKQLSPGTRAATEAELDELARNGFIYWNGITLERNGDFLCPVIEGAFDGDNSTEYALIIGSWVDDHLEERPVIRKNCIIIEQSAIYGPDGVPDWTGFLIGRLRTKGAEATKTAAPAATPITEALATKEPVPDSAPVHGSKKKASLKAYREYQEQWKIDHGAWSSNAKDQVWAIDNNYTQRHVRDKLRPDWVETLPPNEQAKFKFKGGKRRRQLKRKTSSA